MNKKTLAKLFGISENAPDDAFEEAATAAIAQRDDARAQLARVEQLAGKTGSAVLGVLQAWKQSHEELPGAQAKLEKIESDSRTQALDSALDKAKKEKRHTPARETKMRELLDKEHVTHEGALALVATWGVVSALAAGDDDAEPEGSGSNSSSSDGEGLLRHNGKTYVEMTSAERVKLQKHNPEIFKQMRTEAKKAGLI